MLSHVVRGVVAGAVGTAVLNTVTYLDMVIQGRPASSVPADTVEKMTDLLGVSLAEEGNESSTAEARRQGLGALLGYLTGFGIGGVYGLLRPRALAGAPRSVVGVGLGVAATVSTVLPYSALGVSDPRTWSAKSWVSDIVPHLCYGWATAAAFDALGAGRRGDAR